ncbi:MAG: acetoin utilization protein AcuC [Bacillota bacterium]
MSGKAIYIYSNRFMDYEFNENHPFNPLRLQLAVEMAEQMGILLPEEIREPRLAVREELLFFHSPEYVDAVEKAGCIPPGGDAAGMDNFGLGTGDNPVFPGMHQAASLVVGATLRAAELVMEGAVDHVVNIGGGLHHAQRAKASGFCIYNDIGVTIRWLQRHYGARVLYIDTDAHHGDGVQFGFFKDPSVLTVSFHETGRYLFPGTGGVLELGQGEGFGYAVNIPMQPYTEDQSWEEALLEILPPLAKAFQPNVIISQNGCDGHQWDPLSHLSGTTGIYRAIPALVHRLAHEYSSGRWIAVGGGGYDIWRVVPRAWALLWGEASGKKVPDRVPESWLKKWQGKAPVELPALISDSPQDFPPQPRRAEITEKNKITVRHMQELTPLFKVGLRDVN